MAELLIGSFHGSARIISQTRSRNKGKNSNLRQKHLQSVVSSQVYNRWFGSPSQAEHRSPNFPTRVVLPSTKM